MENSFQKQSQGSSAVHCILFGLVLIGFFHAASSILVHGLESLLIFTKVEGNIYKYFFPVSELIKLALLVLLLTYLFRRYARKVQIPRGFSITLMVLWPILSFVGYGLMMLNNRYFASNIGYGSMGEISVWRSASSGLSHLAYIITIIVALAIAMGGNTNNNSDFSGNDFQQH